MVLVILLIGLVLGFTGYFMYHRSNSGSYAEAVGNVLGPVGWTMAIVAGMTAFGLLCASLCMSTADEKIEMYQQENIKIEQQIADVVEQYQKYETDIFTDLAPESAVTMVSLYPELKSDTLVQKQIEVYTINNDNIKWYKSQLIDRAVVNWWLYFGS